MSIKPITLDKIKEMQKEFLKNPRQKYVKYYRKFK